MVVLALVAAACGGKDVPQPGGSIESTAVVFAADASAPADMAAVADEPIDLRALAGWYAVGRTARLWDDDGRLRGIEPGPLKGEPGKAYVVATAGTGCRLTTGTEVSRDGTDLRVRFTGGTDHPECVRAYQAVAQVAVPAAAIDGIRTVNAKSLLGPAGPGRLTAFVPLGSLRGRPETPAAELPATRLYDVLRTASALNLDKAKVALDARPAQGQRSFAFVLSGCANSGAVLLVSPKLVTAALTGEREAVCDAAAYYLAVFTIDSDRVPQEAVVG